MPKISTEHVFVFESDFSKENPALHRLYVAFALEELDIIDTAVDALSELSRVNADITAGVLIDRKAHLVNTDAAYRDAAALRSSGQFRLDPDPRDETAEKVKVTHA